jgi:excisionase family DNA binding protein
LAVGRPSAALDVHRHAGRLLQARRWHREVAFVASATPARHRLSLAASRSAGERPLTAADVLTAAEVAALLRVPKSTVEDWARRNIVPSRKVGRRRLYIRSRIEALLLDEHAATNERLGTHSYRG